MIAFFLHKHVIAANDDWGGNGVVTRPLGYS